MDFPRIGMGKRIVMVRAASLVLKMGIQRQMISWIRNAFARLWDTASLLVLLSIVATIPILQFASFGYMLESATRVSRGVPLRRCFPGADVAGKLAVILGCVFLSWLPVWFVADMAYSAELIEQGGQIARQWRIAARIISVIWILWVLWAVFRGGKLRHFLWPAPILAIKSLFQAKVWREAEDKLWDFVVSLKLPRLLWLGFMASIGALLWLLIPGTLILIGLSAEGQAGLGVIGLIGAALMWWVLLNLPFLQIHMANQARFLSVFDLQSVRRSFRQAPWAFCFATWTTFLFAVPLYLFRIERVPSQLWWLMSLFFIVSMFPAKLFTGWALFRSAQRSERHIAHPEIRAEVRWYWRYVAWVPQLAVVLVYLGVLYLAKFVVWEGGASFYLQHAFLPPVPFFFE